MRIQLKWYRALPAGLALRLTIIFAARKLLRVPAFLSFSQGAEDLLLRLMMGYKGSNISDPGSYVDVGCNLPITDSNTFDLYLRGWRGLNLDANSEMIDFCKRIRKEDVSVVAAVSDAEREVVFHRSATHLVSTIDPETLVEWKKHWEFRDEDQQIVTTRTLTSILDEFWGAGRSIDVLSIDVEGHDFQVLRGLDFAKYRPKIIVVEMPDFDRVRENEIYTFLTGLGYGLKQLAYLNAYFADETMPLKT